MVPLALGGSDDEENLAVVCHPCHLANTRLQFGYKPRSRTTGPPDREKVQSPPPGQQHHRP